MSPRTSHRISLAAGLIVLLLAIASTMLPAPRPCGALPENYAPIIAFEMVRSVSDLQLIFGTQPDSCREAMRAQMDRVNWLDWLVYIPAYGAFLLFFFTGVSARAPRLASVAIKITIVACAADYIENRCLFALSAQPDIDSVWITLLFIFTEVKWIGLGIATLIGGGLLARGGGWRALLLVPCSLGLIASLVSIPAPAVAGPILSTAFAVGWLPLLIANVRPAFARAP